MVFARWSATISLFLTIGQVLLGQPALAELQTVKVTEGIYALVGDKAQRSPENLGNNATFGVVVTENSVLLIDAGGSWQGAAEIDAAIRRLTDKPVSIVINTGGQDHRWLGNGYWRAKGARIYASTAALEDQRERASMQLSMLSQLLGDALAGTEPEYADKPFEHSLTLNIDGLSVEIIAPGQAHTPGDSYVWLPDRKIVFAGDIVFVERLLGLLNVSHAKSWINAFEVMAEHAPQHVIPGHGSPTTLARAKADTHDYLVNLHARIGDHIDAGGDIISSVEVDQSAFAYLEQFDTLARRNAQQAFSEMEWE